MGACVSKKLIIKKTIEFDHSKMIISEKLRYIKLGKIGRGKFSEVYKIAEPDTNQT